MNTPINLTEYQINKLMLKINDQTNRTSSPPCWLWIGYCAGRDKNTPNITIDYKHYIISRLVYYIYNDRIDPGDLLVCHNCKPNPDNKLCINPEHLYLGTCSDNNQDAYDKGQRTTPINFIGNQAIFSDDQVRLIRKLYKETRLTLQNIADQFNVNKTTINRIILYKTYPNVPD